jgi:hypothetical protein
MTHKITVQPDSKFQLEGVAFKMHHDGHGATLWADGGQYDDMLIKSLPPLNDSGETEIEVTDAELSKARVYIGHSAD